MFPENSTLSHTMYGDHRENPVLSTTNMSSQNPHEDALQSLCKQILKSRFFRGFYEERRYVESVSGYRDIIALHRGERDLQKILLDIKEKLQLFYQHKPTIWIGITNGALPGAPVQTSAFQTYIWAELDDMAFGAYWFSVKSVRFREMEIILKLKMIRPADDEGPKITKTPLKKRASSNSANQTLKEKGMSFNAETITADKPVIPQVDLGDFLAIMQDWGRSIKHTAYDFMSNDVNKDNIVNVLKFFGLVIVSLLSSAIVGIKFLGVFTLRFMFEFSRFTHIMTPILLKVIEVCNKIVGGFYILLAMVWKDIVGSRLRPKAEQLQLDYVRPPCKSIEYKVHDKRRYSKPKLDDFERKLQ